MAPLSRRPSARNMKPEEPVSPISCEPRSRSSVLSNTKILAALGFFAFCGFVGGWSRMASSSRIAPPWVPDTEAYAVAYMSGPNSNVSGVVYFTQGSPTGPVFIRGELKNLDPQADRGFHIHEFGDATDGCMSSGAHYNPFGMVHGAPKDIKRHVGDLGNIRSDSKGVANIEFSDSVISLFGPFSIVGRTVLVHTGTDDLGRGDNDDSLKTGNAGGRAACGVIGYAKPTA